MLEKALLRAERSILIVGWDFDARVRLRPDLPDTLELGQFLRSLVEKKAGLNVRVLVWDLATLYAPGQTVPLVLGDKWDDHPRIEMRLDHNHPISAAQHQKIVCIDGKLAFVGGIDLTVMRWDTSDHSPDSSFRSLPGGEAYVPVHDLQMAIDGDAAGQICAIVGERWHAAAGEDLPQTEAESDPWPDELKPDFLDVEVAVARTAPAWAEIPERHEIAALNADILNAAKHTIYMEAQYLAERRLVNILSARLREPDGPEVVILVTRATHGYLEKWIMGGNRDRMIRKLRRADRRGRLGVFYPVVKGNPGCEILVHAKLIIADDVFLKVGSSNVNRRSMGLDSECDLAIESDSAEMSKAILAIRNRLIAEHVDATPEKVADAIEIEGSVLRAIARLNTKARRLESFDHIGLSGPTHLMPGTRFLDPRKPYRWLAWLAKRRVKVQRSE